MPQSSQDLQNLMETMTRNIEGALCHLKPLSESSVTQNIQITSDQQQTIEIALESYIAFINIFLKQYDHLPEQMNRLNTSKALLTGLVNTIKDRTGSPQYQREPISRLKLYFENILAHLRAYDDCLKYGQKLLNQLKTETTIIPQYGFNQPVQDEIVENYRIVRGYIANIMNAIFDPTLTSEALEKDILMSEKNIQTFSQSFMSLDEFLEAEKNQPQEWSKYINQIQDKMKTLDQKNTQYHIRSELQKFLYVKKQVLSPDDYKSLNDKVFNWLMTQEMQPLSPASCLQICYWSLFTKLHRWIRTLKKEKMNKKHSTPTFPDNRVPSLYNTTMQSLENVASSISKKHQP